MARAQNRRLAKDFEAMPASAEAELMITSIQLHDAENRNGLISFIIRNILDRTLMSVEERAQRSKV